MTVKALETIQQRLLDQYLHEGKKRSYKINMDIYRQFSARGSKIGFQTGVPFGQNDSSQKTVLLRKLSSP